MTTHALPTPTDQAPDTAYTLLVPGLITVYANAPTEAAVRNELALEGADTIDLHDPHPTVGRLTITAPSNPQPTDPAPPGPRTPDPGPPRGDRGPGRPCPANSPLPHGRTHRARPRLSATGGPAPSTPTDARNPT
ncbi:hypothetical protein ACH419_36455 [Streptomyces bobili]|uniref:hypothetical protein n=1 Tax=Streptomyces bobili TaxID=67280 RepID=UPI0037BC3C16